MKSILKYHNVPLRGNREQLILKVSLLPFKRGLSSTSKERKYKTDTCSSTDLENPRKKASAFPVYTKNRLAVPDDISESNVHKTLQSLEDDVKTLTQFEESTNTPCAEFHDKKYYNKTEQYEFF